MGDRGREDRKGRGKGKGKRKISPPRSFLEVGAYVDHELRSFRVHLFADHVILSSYCSFIGL